MTLHIVCLSCPLMFFVAIACSIITGFFACKDDGLANNPSNPPNGRAGMEPPEFTLNSEIEGSSHSAG